MLERSRPVIVYASGDDERSRVAMALRSEGLDVHETTGGAGAVAMAKASLPDAVVLDVNLRDVALDAVIARLRREPMTEATPIILTSKSQASTTERTELLDVGANAYVAESDAAELAACVRALLRLGGTDTDDRQTSLDDVPVESAARITPERSRPSTRLRVLLVDDNVDSCSLFEMALTNQGHSVDTAFDGVEGLERLLAGSYDVAVVDIGLPGLDGYELARRARAVLAERTPLLIAMTGYGRDSDRVASREAGFGVHLVKPVDVRILVGRLEGELASAHGSGTAASR